MAIWLKRNDRSKSWLPFLHGSGAPVVVSQVLEQPRRYRAMASVLAHQGVPMASEHTKRDLPEMPVTSA